MSEWRDFGGVNEGYALELYERFRRDPDSVDPATRARFEKSGPPPAYDAAGTAPALLPSADLRAVVGAVNLAESIRRYGHLAARIDPLGSTPIGDPALLPETHGVTEARSACSCRRA